MLRQVPSLSRLLDIHLEAEVVDKPPTNIKQLQTVTVSIPTDEYKKMTGDEIETLYLRPMVKALAEKINTFGSVRAAPIPIKKFPKTEQVWLCTNGRIPVTLRIVRREIPTDRHQILIHALIQQDEN